MNVIRNHLLGLDPEDTKWDTVSHADGIRVPEPYVIPDVGHLPMVVHPELVNPVVSDFLVKNCGLHTLSGAWQALHRTKGENKWDLKNYEKVNDIDAIRWAKCGLPADPCVPFSGLGPQTLLQSQLVLLCSGP